MTDDDLLIAVGVGLGLLAIARFVQSNPAAGDDDLVNGLAAAIQSAAGRAIGPAPDASPPVASPVAPGADPPAAISIEGDVDVVRPVWDEIRPVDAESAFEVTKRVAWLLRGTGAGLLEKPGGENIVAWQGHSFAAARLCYPNGQLVKILSDVGAGGANAPSWQIEDIVDASRYVPAIDPAFP